jgi:DNA polymerase III psi subunit
MSIELTKETIDTIRGNMLLLDEISKELKVKPETVLRLSFKNYQRLTQLSVLQIISKHTGKPVEKLVRSAKIKTISE